MLFYKRCLLGVTKVTSYAHKTGPCDLLGLLYKISDEHPRPFLNGCWQVPFGLSINTQKILDYLHGRTVIFPQYPGLSSQNGFTICILVENFWDLW